MSEKVRVLIADDHTIFRQGLQKLLEAYKDIEVVGEAANGRQAVSEASRLSPDLIIMDIKMPELDGIEAMELIKREHPEIKIVALSMYEDAEYVLKAIRAGASSYVQKSTTTDRLIETIKQTHRGNRLVVQLAIDSDVLMEVAPTISFIKGRGLTEQERHVLQLIVDGHANKQIAQQLFVSEQTVKGYVHNILRKMGASDRTQAAAIALREGLSK